MNHGDVDKPFTVAGRDLVVFGMDSIIEQPSKRPFDEKATRHHLKAGPLFSSSSPFHSPPICGKRFAPQFVCSDDKNMVWLRVRHIDHTEIASATSPSDCNTRSFSSGSIFTRRHQNIFNFMLLNAMSMNPTCGRFGPRLRMARQHRTDDRVAAYFTKILRAKLGELLDMPKS